MFVLASCAHHACLQRRGHEARGCARGNQRATPPSPHRAPVPRRNRSRRGGQEGKSQGKGAAPPPPPRRQVPRNVLASCPQRAYPGGRDNTKAPATPPPPPHHRPPPKKTKRTNTAPRGRRRGCREGDEGQGGVGGGHGGEHSASKRAGKELSNKQGGRNASTRNPNLNAALQLSCIVPVPGRAEGGSEGQVVHGRSLGAEEEAREGGKTRAGIGRAEADTAGGGGRDERCPQGTQARGAASGVCPPPPR